MSIADLIHKLGIVPNEMQERTIDAVMHSKDDLMVLSPTGTGKTLAYLLPICAQASSSSSDVQAIVVVPGRELAAQQEKVMAGMGSGLRAMACYGGRPAMDEHRALRQRQPQVIFGTPGRLNDHIGKGNIRVDGIATLVIDEFDKCLEMGFRNELLKLLESMPRHVRILLFSATDPQAIQEELTLYFPARPLPAKLDFTANAEEGQKRVCTYVVRSEEKDKLPALSSLLRCLGNSSTIVFLNYRESVERVADSLRQQGFCLSAYHGGLDQKEREQALYRFVNKSANVLVSTNLGSRGLDIPHVDNIIHYHLPENEEDYVHRVGRTARWDQQGNTFFLLSPEESLPEYVHGQAEPFAPVTDGKPVPEATMETIYIGKGKKDKLSKGDIVGFLCKAGGLSATEIGKVDVFDHYAYVAVSRSKVRQTLKRIDGQKIKGLKTVFELGLAR